MRNALAYLAVVAALSAPPALAQFQNRSIGASVGYLDLQRTAGLSWGVPLGIHATTYFDSHIEGTLYALGMLAQEPVSKLYSFGGTMQMGVRYLFMQEFLRPYVGVEGSYLGVFGATGSYSQFVGVGPMAGIDYFINDNLTLGVRAQYNLYILLNAWPQTSFGLTLEVATWY